MLARWVLLVLLLCFPSVAFAQASPSGDSVEGVEPEDDPRVLYDQGELAYTQGRFDEALALFQRAYDLSGRAELLYNVGIAATNSGDERTALAAFERYLAEIPDASNRQLVEGRLAGLREEIEEEETILRYAEAERRAQAEERRAQAEERAAGANAARSAGWGMTIAGGVLAVGGAIVLGLGYADFFTVEGAAAGTPWIDLRSANERAPILTGAGYGAAGLGLALLGVGLGLALGTSDPPSSTAPRAAIGVSPMGIHLEGAF